MKHVTPQRYIELNGRTYQEDGLTLSSAQGKLLFRESCLLAMGVRVLAQGKLLFRESCLFAMLQIKEGSLLTSKSVVCKLCSCAGLVVSDII